MLSRWARNSIFCFCAMAVACGASATGTGLTGEFAEAARDAHSYMKSDLIPAIGTARFSTVLAASRARVKLAQPKAAGEADQGVWLLMTMVNVKANESNGMKELSGVTPPSRAAREAASDLANELDHCLSEVEGWLTGTSLHVRSMNDRPCLKQARLAAAVLSRNQK